MAYNNSGLLSMGSTYNLGQYSIRCFATVEAGERYVLAHISGPEGNSQNGISIGTYSELYGWYCEANEYTVTIYVEGKSSGHLEPTLVVPLTEKIWSWGYEFWWNPNIYVGRRNYDPGERTKIGAKTSYNARVLYLSRDESNVYIKADAPIYTGFNVRHFPDGAASYSDGFYEYGPDGWLKDEYTREFENVPIYAPSQDLNSIVARFPISLKNAGGGPSGSNPSWGSDVDIWEEPGDVDYDWDVGEPTKTLYIMGQGSTSGRHNDPIVDPSFSYSPKPKETVKSDGNGGDGGNGGGGGAGASTLLTRPFATGQADNKVITLHARRHGYGSTGGKGGKAGDGCILIYYRTGEE